MEQHRAPLLGQKFAAPCWLSVLPPLYAPQAPHGGCVCPVTRRLSEVDAVAVLPACLSRQFVACFFPPNSQLLTGLRGTGGAFLRSKPQNPRYVIEWFAFHQHEIRRGVARKCLQPFSFIHRRYSAHWQRDTLRKQSVRHALHQRRPGTHISHNVTGTESVSSSPVSTFSRSRLFR